jgi:hypothetical protein
MKDDEQRFRETVAALGAVTEADMHTAAEMAGTNPQSISLFIRRLAGKPLAIELPPEVIEEEITELSLPSIEVSEADTDLEGEEDGEF